MTEPIPEPRTDSSNRRNHFRVEYPAQDRPTFTARQLSGEVTDCSETGVRVLVPAGFPGEVGMVAGEPLSATIRFAEGETVEVEGTVVRHAGTTLVLRLDVAQIPFGRIIREQRWLRSRYPWRDLR
jgi:hypothetical protein